MAASEVGSLSKFRKARTVPVKWFQEASIGKPK